jgi:hypothetical protein
MCYRPNHLLIQLGVRERPHLHGFHKNLLQLLWVYRQRFHSKEMLSTEAVLGIPNPMNSRAYIQRRGRNCKEMITSED